MNIFWPWFRFLVFKVWTLLSLFLFLGFLFVLQVYRWGRNSKTVRRELVLKNDRTWTSLIHSWTAINKSNKGHPSNNDWDGGWTLWSARDHSASKHMYTVYSQSIASCVFCSTMVLRRPQRSSTILVIVGWMPFIRLILSY